MEADVDAGPAVRRRRLGNSRIGVRMWYAPQSAHFAGRTGFNNYKYICICEGNITVQLCKQLVNVIPEPLYRSIPNNVCAVSRHEGSAMQCIYIVLGRPVTMVTQNLSDVRLLGFATP